MRIGPSYTIILQELENQEFTNIQLNKFNSVITNLNKILTFKPNEKITSTSWKLSYFIKQSI